VVDVLDLTAVFAFPNNFINTMSCPETSRVLFNPTAGLNPLDCTFSTLTECRVSPTNHNLKQVYNFKI
jgi:hypothetical protein